MNNSCPRPIFDDNLWLIILIIILFCFCGGIGLGFGGFGCAAPLFFCC